MHILPSVRRVVVVACVVALLWGTGCREASRDDGFAGTWGATVDDRVFMILRLEKTSTGFTGAWEHPEHFQTSDGLTFSGVSGGVLTEPILSTSEQDSNLRVVVQDPRNAAEKTEFLITLTSDEQATAAVVGTPFDPWHFKRLREESAALSAKWNAQRLYTLDRRSEPANPEMRALFDEDQKARQGDLPPDAWKTIAKEDADRRRRTREWLASGRLRAAEDFRLAAFIFQHGDTPDDFLMAHTLASVALAKGDSGAAWISAATLDRYLSSIGKPQIYGTQFTTSEGKPPAQEPYNRGLISDALRRELRVPAIAEQQAQFAAAQAALKGNKQK